MIADFNEIIRFGFLIHDVSRMRKITADRALKPLGVTRSQWWLLAVLSRRDGMTQTALAKDLDVTKVSLGALISRLESSGFVERREDADDGRARRVFLAEKGRDLIAAVRERVEASERQSLSRVSTEDLDIATTALRGIRRRLLDLIEADSDFT